ncbi:MAG TPA: hypothetical protein DCZ20_11185 [Lachnospiraceae bacterium]|nr:hypothetical protein [Lachnospiraceae bacterium]
MEYRKRLEYQSNYWYNDGLKKAKIRDLTGAMASLRRSLQYNRENIDARNLLGLVYYGRGEVAEALVEWIISKNFKAHGNIAEYFISRVQEKQTALEEINQAIKKYNQCLVYCNQSGEDMAIIQLKKVVAAHPSFVKAYQLLALLYLKTEQYPKARQALRRAHNLDTTDDTTLRYLHELHALSRKKEPALKEEKEHSVTYQLGNETIIQPAQAVVRDNSASVTFLNILIGFLVGAAVVWFLIVPAVEATRSRNESRQSVEYSQEIASQKAQVSALKKELESYRTAGDLAEAAQADAASTIESYEALMTVARQYSSGDYSYADMAENLRKVNAGKLGEAGLQRYSDLAEEIYPTVCNRLYRQAEEYHDSGDTANEITVLENIISMQEGYENGEALLALADAYTAAGEADKGKEKYNRVIELFPDTSNAQKAQKGLEGQAANVFGSSYSDDEE